MRLNQLKKPPRKFCSEYSKNNKVELDEKSTFLERYTPNVMKKWMG